MEHDLEILAFLGPCVVLYVLLRSVLSVTLFSPDYSILRVSVAHIIVSCVSVVLLASRVTRRALLGRMDAAKF